MKAKKNIIKTAEHKIFLNNPDGITLISLVVTIIILLILAVISFNAAFGENGVISKAVEGSRKWKEAEEFEKAELDKIGNLLHDKEIEYWDGTVSDSFSGGDGTKENPYQISNGKELARFAYISNTYENYEVDIHGILVSNIYLNRKDNFIYTWTSISKDSQFTGTFNGNNFFISGLYFTKYNNSDMGLFGYNFGIINDLGIIDSLGDAYHGGMFAYHNGGTIKNCYNSGTISVATSMGIGGLVGNNYGIIEDSYNLR